MQGCQNTSRPITQQRSPLLQSKSSPPLPSSPKKQHFPASLTAWKWVSVKWNYTLACTGYLFFAREKTTFLVVVFKHWVWEFNFWGKKNNKELFGGFEYLSPPDIFQSCLEMGGWSWHIGTHHWGSGFRKHFFIRSGKKLLDPVGIFTSNLMHGSIFDTDYAATQTDLSKLQGKEEKRRLLLQNKSCQLQGNL